MKKLLLLALLALLSCNLWKEKGQSGLFVVLVNDQFGYINKAGDTVISPQFDNGLNFAEGLAQVAIGEEDQKWGYIDENGSYVINPQFDETGPFSQGLAVSPSLSATSSSTATSTPGGKKVIEPQFREARDFSEGRAAVYAEANGKAGYIDKSGTLVVSPQYADAYDFSEGLGCVRGDDDKSGFVDRTGVVIERQFDGAEASARGWPWSSSAASSATSTRPARWSSIPSSSGRRFLRRPRGGESQGRRR